MDIKDLFLILSIIVGLITPIIGIRSIIIGHYKPHRITRLIFLIVTTLFVASLFAQGENVGIILALIQLIGSTLIFILSFKFGVGGTSVNDIIVLTLAILTMIVWKSTDNAELGLYMSIVTDFIGILPTLVKSFKEPYTEDPKFYANDTIAGLLNIFALRSYMINDLAFPGYIFMINLTCLALIVSRRRYMKVKLQSNQKR